MKKKRCSHLSSAWLLVAALLTVSLPPIISAQTAAPQNRIAAPEYSTQLQKIEEKIEKRRADLGVPGAALAIVKDDKIIYLKGFGYKDFEKKIAATPDTQFAIGSSTKAFTALSVLMSQDAGRLSLDDNPKKYLPYFKINNPETDRKITIRDLLSHSSGLTRTDLAMVTGKLTREELIRVAGEAKPTAGLREKWQYQNIMFAAAGEAVARANKTTWEKFVAERIFKLLGMTNSNLSLADIARAKDFSFGYEYNTDTKETRRIPTQNIQATAPAGAINSSVRDVAQWVRFMLAGGVAPNGKRLISENLFAELTKPQMKIAGRMSYGLGWFLQEWNGLKVVQHGGNIGGFNTMVAMIPEKKLGFVLLTNVSNSPLTTEAMNIVWSNLLGKPEADKSTATAAKPEEAIEKLAPEKIAGAYKFKEAGFNIEIAQKDGKLLMTVPAQPVYALEAVAGNKYKMTPLPEGFFATFRPVGKDSKEIELVLDQPGQTFILARATEADTAALGKKAESYRDFVGNYEFKDDSNAKAEIVLKDGALTINLTGQPPLAMIERGSDAFGFNGLPETFKVSFKRGTDNKISGIVFNQPNGDFEYKRVGDAATASNTSAMTVDDLMPKVIEALGGEAAWRKMNSRVTKFDVDFVNQGVKGSGTEYAKAPNSSFSEVTLTALGKLIASIESRFDGAAGGTDYTFGPGEKFTGKQLADARINADFYGLLDWRTNYKKAEMKLAAKIGDEPVFVVVFEPEAGNKDTIYFSQKNFLPVKLDSFESSPTSGIDLPYSETYSDYRSVEGVMLPFKTVNSNLANGDLVTILKTVKFNVAVDDKMFQPKNNQPNQKRQSAVKSRER